MHVPLLSQAGRRAAGALLLAAALPALAPAKIDLVTLPERASTELTIYNSEDLTLVRETRTLSFDEGVNEIQFSWANTLIDPTSLRLDLKDSPGLVLSDAVYPADTEDLVVWIVEAEEETSAAVEISYFTSGLTWSADYRVRANAEETALTLQQFITVRNNSGEDFVNANTRVVVGEVALQEAIAELAQRGIKAGARDVAEGMLRSRAANQQEVMYSMDAMAPMAAGRTLGAEERKEAAEIIRQAVSEYYVFSVEGEETIENGWAKELPTPAVAEIPFDLSYEIDPQKYGEAPVKFYKFENDEAAELGTDPLPAGMYYVYSTGGQGGLQLEGRTRHDYVPVGEEAELNLGADGRVAYEERLLDLQRRGFQYRNGGNLWGWEELATHVMIISNTHDRALPLKLTRHFSGDWEFDSVSNTDYERVDESTVRWEFDLPPGETTRIEYTIVYRMGGLARR